MAETGIPIMTLLPTLSRCLSQFCHLEVRHRSRRSGVRAGDCATIANQGNGLSDIRIQVELVGLIYQIVNPSLIDKYEVVIRALCQATGNGHVVAQLRSLRVTALGRVLRRALCGTESCGDQQNQKLTKPLFHDAHYLSKSYRKSG